MTNGMKQLPFPSVLIFLILLPVFYSHHSPVKYVSFKDTTNEKFNHIAVDETTGRVYVGAVNRIYQLTEDLNLEASALMGPNDDSPNCPVSRVCPGVLKVATNYYNKALLIDSSQSKLVACGSLFQGVCTLHNLNDVSTYNTAANESVVANKDTASTVAFIAPGPADTINQPNVLYVGVSYTGYGPYSSDVPAVSSRSLDPSKMLTLFHSDQGVATKMYVNSMSREIYPITYIYGFSSEGFSYFVTVQKLLESYPSSGPFFTRLVRICQNDVGYYSYTEIPLSCKGEDGMDYNLAQAAYIKIPGHKLAKHVGVTDGDELFVVFAKSKDDDNEPTQNSALCTYPMSAVRTMFTRNIQYCFGGNGLRGLEFIVPNIRCFQAKINVDDDFCGIDVNTPLGGTIPMEAAAILRFPGVLLTAVAAASTHDHTVIFLGTSTGHLKKAAIETADEASEHSDIVIEEGSPVNPDLVFDKTKTHLYVMTQNKVTRVNVLGCDRFNTCSECTASGIPYCGWCSVENRCLTREDCVESGHDSICWISHKNNQCYAPIELTGISNETADTTGRGEESHGRSRSPVMEQSKLTTLQDIAQSMRNIDKSLRELIDLQKQKD